MKFNRTGNIIQQELQIDDNTQNFNTPIAVTLNNSNIFVHFYGDLDGEVMIINSTGSLVQAPKALYPGSTGTAYLEQVCLMNNGNVFVVSCFSSGGFYYGNYAIFDRNGGIVLTKQQISNVGSNAPFQPFCQCLSNGNCVMIWSVENGTSFDVAMATVNSTGSRISQKIALKNMAKNIYGTASFSDGSILIAALTSTPGSINISYFNSDLDPIYVSETCKPPLNVITPDKKGCFSTIVNCSTYNNDGTCNSCVNSTALALSVNNKTCVPRITGCELYNDNSTCQRCNNTTILTEGLVNCANPIVNCQIYWDNKTCKNCLNLFAISIDQRECINASSISGCLTYNNDGTCNTCENSTILSLGKLACVNPFRNCSKYNDDGTCNNCINSSIPSIGKLACVSPLLDCLTYNENGTCNTCGNSKILSIGKWACVQPIINCVAINNNGTCSECKTDKFLTDASLNCTTKVENCSSYLDLTGVCQKCKDPYVLSFGNDSCVLPIPDCINQSSNGICFTCKNSKQLTVTSTACLGPIIDCFTMSDQGTCINCTSAKTPSFKKTACVIGIPSCRQETDDNKCSLCFFGYAPSADNSSCVEVDVPAEQYNNTLQSKILTDSSNQSTQNTNFLSKDQNTSIEIVNGLSANYEMGLANDSILFTSKESNITVKAQQKPGRKTNSISIVANLKALPSSSYSVKIDLGFSKTKRRNLQENETETLPDYFSLSYKPPVSFFVGTDEQISQEQKRLQEGSIMKELTKDDIIAIVFSIFGFILLVCLASCIWKLATKNSVQNKKEIKAAVYQEAHSIKNSAKEPPISYENKLMSP